MGAQQEGGMFEKDMMEKISGEFNSLSDEEKERRKQSLKQLLDNELARRQNPQSAAPLAKPAKKKKTLWQFLFGPLD